MNVQELREILNILDDWVEIVIEDDKGKEPATQVSLFKNVDGKTRAIIE